MGTPCSVVLVGGGVRSGKSAFALWRAKQLGARRVFVATAQVLDHEMGERVQRHVLERGQDFRTVEAPRGLCEALEGIRDADVVVVDCLTLWLTNLLMDGLSRGSIEEHIDALGVCLRRLPFHTVLVSNEVGLGIVPDNSMARAFRDLAGTAHQRLGAVADEVYVGVFGQLLRLKPSPVEAQVFPR